MKTTDIIARITLTAALISFCLKLQGQPTNKQPQENWPPVHVQFLCVTNDSSGTTLARFELHNTAKETWIVALPGFVDRGPSDVVFIGQTNAILLVGASMETSLPEPNDLRHWRAGFRCKPATEERIYIDIFSKDVAVPPNTALEPTPTGP